MTSLQWQPWKPLSPAVQCHPETLAEILDEGQAFRWNPDKYDAWQGTWGPCLVKVRSHPVRAQLEWTTPKPHAENNVAAAISEYFDAYRDYRSIEHDLPWRSDAVLAAAMNAFPGTRILRQPPGETLLAFLCSSTKRIPQIKQCCERIADRHGSPIPSTPVKCLPDWKQLAEIPEKDLRACGIGYRARYVYQCAQLLREEPNWLDRVAEQPYEDARKELLKLPGVGNKIADCVLLYGMGKMEAFPVDTWVHKIMTQLYGLQGWSLEQIAHFGRLHFGPAAGLAQQYLFAAMRRQKLT